MFVATGLYVFAKTNTILPGHERIHNDFSHPKEISRSMVGCSLAKQYVPQKPIKHHIKSNYTSFIINLNNNEKNNNSVLVPLSHNHIDPNCWI